MNSLTNNKGISGVFLALIAMFVAFLSVVGSSLLSGSNDSESETDKISATGILGQANNLQSALDRAASRGVGYADVTFNADPNTGLFYFTALSDSNPGGVGGTTSTTWADPGTSKLYQADLGYRTADLDFYIQINEISQGACQSINEILKVNNGAPMTSLPTGGASHGGCFENGGGFSFFKMVKAY